MIQFQANLTAYQMPDDRDAAHARLIAAMDGAKERIRLFMYGFTDGALAQALLRANKRGVDVALILDHTQSCGPTEAAMLHGLIVAGFPADGMVISTSPLHRQIMHEKGLICDGILVFEGSTNWSPTGFLQENTLMEIPSPDYGAFEEAKHDALKAWALQNETHYQLAS